MNYRYLKGETHNDLLQVIVPGVVFDHYVTPYGVHDNAKAFRRGSLRAGLLKSEGGLADDRGEGVTHVVHTTLEELVTKVLEGIATLEQQRVA